MRVSEGGVQLEMIPRTLEESIAYENFALLRAETLSIGKTIPPLLPEAYKVIYERIGSKDFKKTDFAMSLLAAAATWTVPPYIAEGLRWLEMRLCGESTPNPLHSSAPSAGAAV